MRNYRKEQLKLAVLMEVGNEPKKNGDIIVGAEKRFNPDEKYNELMQNGKQTKGRKELQFILYDFKKEEIVDVVNRGIFRESNRTWNVRMEILFELKEKIDSGILKPEDVMFTADTIKEIETIYTNNQGWEPKPEPERKTATENSTETGGEASGENNKLDFSSLEGNTEKNIPIPHIGESEVVFDELDTTTSENGETDDSEGVVIYDTDFVKAIRKSEDDVKVIFKNKEKKDAEVQQVENSADTEIDKDSTVNNEDTSSVDSDVNSGNENPTENELVDNSKITVMSDNKTAKLKKANKEENGTSKIKRSKTKKNK